MHSALLVSLGLPVGTPVPPLAVALRVRAAHVTMMAEPKAPSTPIVAAGKGMPLLSPLFNLEAIAQAAVLHLGSYDREAIAAEIKETASSSPVVIYTYPLSPFSSEAVSV